jgi:hypothetical protein
MVQDIEPRHTSSTSVSQKLLVMSVTTRPGAPGTPRWSSLFGIRLVFTQSTNRVTHLAYSSGFSLSFVSGARLPSRFQTRHSPRPFESASYLPEASYIALDEARDSLVKVRWTFPDQTPTSILLSEGFG